MDLSTRIELGSLVRKHRIKNNITQLHLANALGFDQSQMIYAIEKGISKIPDDKIAMICKLLDIDVNKVARILKVEATNKINTMMGIK